MDDLHVFDCAVASPRAGAEARGARPALAGVHGPQGSWVPQRRGRQRQASHEAGLREA